MGWRGPLHGRPNSTRSLQSLLRSCALAADDYLSRVPNVRDGVMDPDLRRVLEQTFPGEDARYFNPIFVGSTPASADEGAAAILTGAKTTTSSPFWDWPDGRIPFVGALSVLLNGRGRMCAIVETTRVEIRRFGLIDEDFAWSYGEGQGTLERWRSKIGAGIAHRLHATESLSRTTLQSYASGLP